MRKAWLSAATLVAVLGVWLLLRPPPHGARLAAVTAPPATQGPRAPAARSDLERVAAPDPARTSASAAAPLAAETRTSAPAPDASDDGAARLVGRLVDPGGVPIAGAMACLCGAEEVFDARDRPPVAHAGEALPGMGPGEEPGGRRGNATTSGPDGRFALRVPVPRGDVLLHVEPVDDHDRFEARFEVDGFGERGPLVHGLTDVGTIRLGEAGSLAGVVSVDGGAPAGEVEVRLRSAFAPDPATAPRGTRADASGRFAFRCVPPGSYTVQATCAGFLPDARHDVRVDPRRTTTGIDLVLRRAPSIAGRVVDEHGLPLALRLVATPLVRGGAPSTGRSDDAGRFRIALVHAGPHHLTPYGSGAQALAPPRERPLVVPGDEDVELVATRPTRLALQVLDAVDDAPLARATVRVTVDDASPASLFEQPCAGPRGVCELELDPRRAFLTVRAPGYVPWSGPAAEEPPGRQTVRLARGGVLRGRVLAGGRPVRAPWAMAVRDAALEPEPGSRATPPSPRAILHEGVTTTVFGAADGTFRVEGLAAGRYRLLVGGAGGAPRDVRDIELGHAREHDVGDVELGATGRVEGRVKAPPGTPLAGVGIHHAMLGRSGERPATFTDVHGRFTLEDLAPGIRSVDVAVAGRRARDPVRFRVEAGETTEVAIDITRSLPFTVHAEITVQGAPVENLRVALHHARSGQRLGGFGEHTDRAGRLVLVDLVRGPVRLVVHGPGSGFLGLGPALDATPGGDVELAFDLAAGTLALELPADLELPRRGDGRITLTRLAPSQGTIREHVNLTLDCAGEGRVTTGGTVHRGTTWDIGLVAPGPYAVRVELDDLHDADDEPDVLTGEVTVEAGARATCTLSARR